RWEATELTDYVVTWSPSCFCPSVTFSDTIVSGEVVSHEVDGETFYETTGKTIGDLLSEIQLALDDDPFQIDAEFDDETGAVVSYWVDVEEMMADEEYGVVVHSVTATDSAVPKLPGGPVITSAHFAVDHGCGHGFAIGSQDQTIGLVLFFSGDWTEEGPSSSEPVDLALSDDWSARINMGDGLFANWCDDVIEESEPTPRVDEEFTVTQGMLTASVDGSTAIGVLVGLVATPTDGSGEPIEIAELALRNDGWGNYAG
ncbi:MAG: hypothetical protein ACI81L_003573, partial [Verrucomicrobiales bacterium]